jgi:hypothetical protein
MPGSASNLFVANATTTHCSLKINAFLDVMPCTMIDGFLENIITSTKLHAITSHTAVKLASTLTHVKFIFSVTELGSCWLNNLQKVTELKPK